MLFNSYPFLFGFLPIVFLGFFLLARKDRLIASGWLVAASLFFYGWWNPKFLSLLLGSIVFNYLSGVLISSSPRVRAKTVLIVAVTSNLLVLAVFKYCNFFISVADSAGAQLPRLDIVLPAGISFFTFTQIAFLVDSYRGLVKEYRLLHYTLFVSWFPHLISGPVLHHKQMMPQFRDEATYRLSANSVGIGLTLFSIGLFKKVILADQFAIYAHPLFKDFSQGTGPAFVDSWVGVLAYALQLYFDFSGYSDMAIGLSRLFNVKLPLNFDSPYKAGSIIDFWRRWHMTLSAFLRDYLYFALGGNRRGAVRRYANLMATMVLGGFWHGAGWGFLVWGAIHGVLLVCNHGWRWVCARAGFHAGKWVAGLGAALTFVAVVVAWVPFRSPTLAGAVSIWKGLAGVNGVALPHWIAERANQASLSAGLDWRMKSGIPALSYEAFPWLLVGLVIVWMLPNSQQLLARFEPACELVVNPYRIAWPGRRLGGIAAGVLLAISILFMTRSSEFLYFQF